LANRARSFVVIAALRFVSMCVVTRLTCHGANPPRIGFGGAVLVGGTAMQEIAPGKATRRMALARRMHSGFEEICDRDL
jgi:hypothetical protein